MANKQDWSKVKNHRKALAGKYMLEGDTQKQALIKAGFAESTAAKPKANGLTADRCIPGALAVEGVEGSQKLIQATRRAYLHKLERISRSDKSIDDIRLGELARALDTIEKYHGAGVGDAAVLDDVRSFADRLRWLKALAVEMKDDTASPVDAEVIE